MLFVSLPTCCVDPEYTSCLQNSAPLKDVGGDKHADASAGGCETASSIASVHKTHEFYENDRHCTVSCATAALCFWVTSKQ